ncbi:ScbA/BarX family gamma-butyrolactone biosynthesis protein [Kitasatospora sp. NPDC048722]|uniref:ScbA/BarX family gamma-butyrolactone biosynthesis protein n=1 Tax=Kitasatospora sp. NPDC048722 TaxID=3155639 RepID=UPI0033E94D73
MTQLAYRAPAPSGAAAGLPRGLSTGLFSGFSDDLPDDLSTGFPGFGPAHAGSASRPADHPTGSTPQLTTTVPKEYVHRACHAEVFLTGSEQLTDTTFTVTAQWPRAHTFFSTPDGTRHDPMQAAETARQAALYLAHTRFGVPLDHKFMIWNLDVTARPRHLSIGATPTDLTLEARVVPRHRGRSTIDFTMSVTVRRGPHVAATSQGRFTTVSDTTYRRLRSAGRTADAPGSDRLVPAPAPADPPLPPARVGRLRPADVVLTPSDEPDTWHLTPDPWHPILFDHAIDHIPGMVLLEAARQAANALTSPVTVAPTTMNTTYHRYAEHDAPTIVTARLTRAEDPDALTAVVTGHQHGTPIFTTAITGRPEHR